MKSEHLQLWLDISEISHVLKESQNLDEILRKTVGLIAKRLNADVCSLYLYQEREQSLIMAASHGLKIDLGQVILKLGEGLAGHAFLTQEPINEADGPQNPHFKSVADINEEHYEAYLALPIVYNHLRVGVIVLQRKASKVFSETDLQALTAVVSQLANLVESARELMAIHMTPQEQKGKVDSPSFVKGKTACPGKARGKSVLLKGGRSLTAYKSQCFVKQYTMMDFQKSIEETNEELEQLQGKLSNNLTELASMVFLGHQLMLKDVSFKGEIEKLIQEGMNPPEAIVEVGQKYVKQFNQSETEIIREKAQDIEDVALRLLENLLETNDRQSVIENHIGICSELYPSDLLALKSQNIAGIIALGGLTGHVALIAKSLDIPMIMVSDTSVLNVLDGTNALMDTTSGNVYFNPSPEVLKQVEKSHLEMASQIKGKVSKKTLTKDGTKVELYANVNLLNDVKNALKFKAVGVGLYRSEFPFMIRNDFPSEEEQLSIYEKLFQGIPKKPVTIRTLDIGGDKLLPYQAATVEKNPFLGLRSIRFSFRHPEIFSSQLRAILRAGYGHDLRVMFPMIASLDDLLLAKQFLRDCQKELEEEGKNHHPSPMIGIMVEIPSTIAMLPELAEECDFFSIGTNDLIQYLMAADRTNERVHEYYLPEHPAVLRTLNEIMKTAMRYKVDVSLCGDMGGDIRFLPFLLGIGMRKLSISPIDILRCQKAIAKIDIEKAKNIAKEMLKAPSVHKVRTDFLNGHLI